MAIEDQLNKLRDDDFTNGFTIERAMDNLKITKQEAFDLIREGERLRIIYKNRFYPNLYHFKQEGI